MDLSDITNQFTALMNRRDLANNSTLVTNFLNASMMRIQRELRCPANEKWVNVSITATTGGLTGSIASGQLTVTAVASGTIISTGQTISDNGVNIPAGVTVTEFVSGTNGGVGVYAISDSALTVSSEAITITMPFPGLTIPSDFLELIGIYPNSDWTVRCKPDKLERVLNYAQFATDKSLLYCRQGGVWQLGPAPAAGDLITIGYWSELEPLIAPTDTNIISIIAWDLIVYGALSEACLFYNDKRRGSTVGPDGKIIDGFEGRFNSVLMTLNEQGQIDELAEASVQPAHRYPDDDTDNYWIWEA